MPTIIAIDVSLSMAYRVSGFENAEKYSRLQLASQAVKTLLDYLTLHSKLEYVSLVTYSSKAEVALPFTRDYESMKVKVSTLEVKDKTDYEVLTQCFNRLVLSEWGSHTPCQVIIMTDGSSSFDTSAVQQPLVLIGFPSSVTVMSIAPSDDMYSPSAMQKIVNIFEGNGKIVRTDVRCDLDSITTFTRDLARDNYSSSNAVLQCGNVVSKIQLLPPPMPYTSLVDFELKMTQVSNVIEICGFIDTADIGTPAAISRHLVLPIVGSHETSVLESFENAETEDDTHDDGKVPSFCVLLHGALKVENMVAVCQLNTNWFGVLFSWTDTKKRSNLMLLVLEPDKISVPWVGDFKYLGVLPSETVVPEADECFPVRPSEKRSYNQNIVVWVKQAGLQSDVQKILRQARKLPEKTNNFYKELNRLRRAAISFGFVELLDGVADIFDRECTMLPGTAHPDCALQLTHSAGILRRPIARDAKYSIPPMRTKFISGMETNYKV